MKTFLIILAVLALGLVVFLRVQQPNPRAAHVAPQDAQFPPQSGVRLIGDDALIFDETPDVVLAELENLALSYQRTSVLDGSIESGMITFLSRTRALAFQDYITARAEATDAGTRLTLAARTRYPGASDWGVNRRRLEQWLRELTARLGQP